MVFGLLNKSPEREPAAPAGPLDRLGRRSAADGRADAAPADRDAKRAAAAASLAETVAPRLRELIASGVPAGEIARQAGQQAQIHFRQNGVMLSPLELRGYVAEVLRPLLPAHHLQHAGARIRGGRRSRRRHQPKRLPSRPRRRAVAAPPPSPAPERPSAAIKPMPWDADTTPRQDAVEKNSRVSRNKVDQARRSLQPLVMGRIDLAAAVSLPRKELVRQLEGLVAELLAEQRIQLNRPEQDDLVYQIVNDMMGFGPLEPLLEDEGITDIMINGPKQIYIEKRGKLELTSVTFEDNAHLLNICNRIVSRVGRRVDECEPDLRCPSARRQPRQHHHPAAGHRRCVGVDPQVRQAPDRLRPDGAAGQHLAGHGDGAAHRRALPAQRHHLGRHRLGQDDHAERAVGHDRERRARGHHRGRRRAALAAAARRPARDAAGQPRGQRRGQHARPRQERAAHAARPHHPGRGARPRGDRPAAGDEHRP